LALAPYITRKCRGGARAGEEKKYGSMYSIVFKKTIIISPCYYVL
jgi:hypothetical protein